jgi:hypothetical protein
MQMPFSQMPFCLGILAKCHSACSASNYHFTMKISFGYFRLVIVLIVILLVVVLQNVVAPLEKTDG